MEVGVCTLGERVTVKYDLVNERGLLGVGIWQLGRGEDRADFYSLMRAKFGQ